MRDHLLAAANFLRIEPAGPGFLWRCDGRRLQSTGGHFGCPTVKTGVIALKSTCEMHTMVESMMRSRKGALLMCRCCTMAAKGTTVLPSFES